jgi:hypothetical protein|tara:strand:- start:72 stop:455 length:384 start_codon:yes stop_codon:yes gene_type:complete
MSKAISRFEFNKNDYAEGTHLLQEYEYKGYFIREFEQEPCDRWKKAMEDENGYELIVGGEMGECGYEILNSTGEVIYHDWYGMGDSATCNAENEVDWFVHEALAEKLGIDISGKNMIEIDELIKEQG